MNLKQLNTIGSGAYFPIQLEEVKDENGNVEMALQPDGTQVPKVRWGMLYGDVRLIKQNLIVIWILSYDLSDSTDIFCILGSQFSIPSLIKSLKRYSRA